MQRPPTKYVANIPSGVGADSSRPYPNIIKYTYSYYRIRVYTLSNTCFHFTEYVYSHHHIRISVSHFVGIFVYAGTINRPLRLLVVCHNAANGLFIMQRPPTKCVANIPSGVGADSSRPYPNIIKCTYSHYQIRVFISTNVCIQIITHVFSHHHIRISVPHFVGVFIYAGTINRPLQLLTVCHYAADGLR